MNVSSGKKIIFLVNLTSAVYISSSDCTLTLGPKSEGSLACSPFAVCRRGRSLRYRHRIDNSSRRRRYTPAVLLFDSSNKGRSSTHYTWRLPVHATSNLSGRHHGLYWRASVRLKSVWSLDYVSPDPVNPQQDQDRGEYVDR